MTVKPTLPIASRRSVVGLGGFLRPPYQHRREALRRRNRRPFPRLEGRLLRPAVARWMWVGCRSSTARPVPRRRQQEASRGHAGDRVPPRRRSTDRVRIRKLDETRRCETRSRIPRHLAEPPPLLPVSTCGLALAASEADCSLDRQPLQERVLYYLGTNRSEVCFTSRSGGRLLLVGGPPFPEKILMWWNFVARTPQEIADARRDWEERRRFGEVTGYSGPRLAAPSLVKFANPNPAS